MIFITIIFLILFVGYLVLMRLAHGKLDSISEGYYTLRKDSRDEWLFHIAMALITFYMFGLAVFTEELSQLYWLFAIGSIGAVFVSAAAAYKKKMTGIIHYVGTAMILGGADLACGFIFGYWWVITMTVWFAVLFYLLSIGKVITNPIYWAEIAALILIVLGVTL